MINYRCSICSRGARWPSFTSRPLWGEMRVYIMYPQCKAREGECEKEPYAGITLLRYVKDWV